MTVGEGLQSCRNIGCRHLNHRKMLYTIHLVYRVVLHPLRSFLSPSSVSFHLRVSIYLPEICRVCLDRSLDHQICVSWHLIYFLVREILASVCYSQATDPSWICGCTLLYLTRKKLTYPFLPKYKQVGHHLSSMEISLKMTHLFELPHFHLLLVAQHLF